MREPFTLFGTPLVPPPALIRVRRWYCAALGWVALDVLLEFWPGIIAAWVSRPIQHVAPYAVVATFLIVWRMEVRLRRRAAAADFRLCPNCVYPLAAEGDAGQCPECGRPYTIATLRTDWAIGQKQRPAPSHARDRNP